MRKLKRFVQIKNRKRKFDIAMSLIKDDDTVIDIGVAPTFKDNANYFENWFNKPNELTCLGLHADFSNFKKKFPNYNVVEFDGFNFPKFEKKFDFGFSNAVIEHVGDYHKQLEWVSGISKICDRLMITTPNRWLPFEAHSMTFFIHWFPLKIRNYIYRKIGKSHYANNYMWLLGLRDLKRLLRDAGFEIITVHKNKFLFFNIDLVIICRSVN